ncbi:transposase [Streptomyces sp. NPDC059009]|uniref:transposase n=1 Tax=Streptomyces sp. NPDC059009 TaxID=3346694 RepID=UPI00368285EF
MTYPTELRRRAVRRVAEVRPEHATEWASLKAVAAELGIGTTQTLRKWVRQDLPAAGGPSGAPSPQAAELSRLRRENAELRRAVEALRAASVTHRL